MNDRKPNDYMDAIKLLDEMLSLKQKDEMLDYTESEIGPSLHFTLGDWIKKNWILDCTSPLGQQILSKKPIDIDEYTNMILKIYHRYLNGKQLKIETEVKNLEELSGK